MTENALVNQLSLITNLINRDRFREFTVMIVCDKLWCAFRHSLKHHSAHIITFAEQTHNFWQCQNHNSKLIIYS